MWNVDPPEGVWGPLTLPLGLGTVWRSQEIGGFGMLAPSPVRESEASSHCRSESCACREGSHLGEQAPATSALGLDVVVTSLVLRTEKIVFLSNQRPS